MAFGNGNTLSSALPIGSMRLAGMMLLGKHAGPPPLRRTVPREQRIADENQLIVLVPGLREIALPFERRRHPALVQAAGIGAREPVLRPEEEQLVAVLVEAGARDEYRVRQGSRPCYRRCNPPPGNCPSGPRGTVAGAGIRCR